MKTRGHWGVRCWRAVGPAALLISVAIPQVALNPPVAVQAATAVPGQSYSASPVPTASAVPQWLQ